MNLNEIFRLLYRMPVRRAVTMVYIILTLSLLSACGNNEVMFSPSDTAEENAASEISDEQNLTYTEEKLCYIYICGEVVNPGVYALPENSRLFEAVDLAGGFGEDAETSSVNLARVVTDGERVYIPSVGETDNAETEVTEDKSGLININTADEAKLCTITGIGPARAKAIIEYREEHGSFAKVDDIKNVSGIKGATFEKIKEYITI